jgi:hypothetical protein
MVIRRAIGEPLGRLAEDSDRAPAAAACCAPMEKAAARGLGCSRRL